jgi:hypothetical protein
LTIYKRTITPNILIITNDVDNASPGLGPTQKYGGVKSINGWIYIKFDCIYFVFVRQIAVFIAFLLSNLSFLLLNNQIRYLCVFSYSGTQQIVWCFIVLFFCMSCFLCTQCFHFFCIFLSWLPFGFLSRLFRFIYQTYTWYKRLCIFIELANETRDLDKHTIITMHCL